MRDLFLKMLYIIAVAIIAITTAHADSKPYDIFSHTVLNLPLDVKSKTSWSKIITTTRDWNLFYSDLLWDGTSEPAELLIAPAIDFDSYQLLVGGLGLQMSGGFSLSIRKIIEYNDLLLVDVLIMRPGENCVVTAALTYPTVAVLTKKRLNHCNFYLQT